MPGKGAWHTSGRILFLVRHLPLTKMHGFIPCYAELACLDLNLNGEVEVLSRKFISFWGDVGAGEVVFPSA